MGSLIRKLKAALGIGAIWGIAFGAVGTALGGLISTSSFLSSALGLTTGLAAATVSLAKRNPSELQSGSDGSARGLLVSSES